jgi:hypothetical protein
MSEETRATAGEETQGHPGGPSHGRKGGSRRLWRVLVGVALLVLGVVTAVLVLANEEPLPEASPVVLDPEVVVLPVPTPTIDPVEVEEGTAFFEALPRTVLAYALVEVDDEPGPLPGRPLESYRLLYSDGGGTEYVLVAGQWRTAEAATQAFEDLVADEREAAEAAGVTSEGSTGGSAEGEGESEDVATTPRIEEGPVEVDQEEVGRYLLVTREDGSGAVWWTNGTALLHLEGPAEGLRDLYGAFPL